MKALRNTNTVHPDRARGFTSAQVNAVTALDNIAASKLPPFAPQRTELHNNGAAGSVTVTMEDGTDLIVELASGETRAVIVPVKAFKSVTTATVTAVCYWWHNPSPTDDKYSVAVVP